MNTKDIQKRVDALAVAMAAKGLIKPEASFEVASGKALSVALRWNNEGRSDYDWEFSHHRAGTPAEALKAADAWVAALPTKDERKFKAFMESVAAAVDMGRQNGIDVEFVNPLEATLKKLSENALTYKGES